MKISSIKNFNTKPVQNPVFKHSVDKNVFETSGDVFSSADDNINSVTIDSYGYLTNIDFKKPVTIANAIKTILKTQNNEVREKMFMASYTEDNLFDMYVDINSDRALKDLKVKKFIGMGVYALVFETTDGDIIKITNGNHFPCNRKPDFFDLPIIRHGQMGRTHYYIEEKVSQNDITDEEIEELITKIEQADYTIQDYLLTKECADNKYGHPFKKRQFGRTKDGKVYLIDPGCAIDEKSLITKLAQKIRQFLTFNFNN